MPTQKPPKQYDFKLTQSAALPPSTITGTGRAAATTAEAQATELNVTLQEDPDPDPSGRLATLGLRSGEQQKRLKELTTSNPKHTIEPTLSIFDQPEAWAYRCFKITPSPKDIPEVQRFQESLYLFNVIVALEWQPSQRYMSMLTRAFQHASDFMYDVTDGYMAFGQVIFGGLELMNCADIQVMASNRLLPRSWVGGLHPPRLNWPEKYMPIRMGRGLWQKNDGVSVDWDEPDGYRTLIHEWAHYALELLDAYLETHDIYLPEKDASRSNSSAQILVRADNTVVVPRISIAVESIMATLKNTSELVPKTDSGPDSKQKEWERIVEKGRYPKVRLDHQPIDGALPIRDLPRFALVYPSATGASTSRHATIGDLEEGIELMLYDFPTDIKPEHCWVYILKHDPDRSDERYTIESPRYIIAQGSLDARALSDGFRLLGAEQDDVLMLIGNADENQIVLQSLITRQSPREDRGANADMVWTAGVKWKPVTPKAFPIIDVIPDEAQHDGTRTPAQLKVRVYQRASLPENSGAQDPHAGNDVPDEKAQITVFDLGYEGAHASPTKPAALDGHVLIRWPSTEGDTFLVSTFSQGGGPPTGTPTGPPPISAGSSEGNLMLFFEDKGLRPDYSKVRVVTTRLYGMPYKLPSGGEARSYAFSLSSTAPLPTELNPTLVMYYDRSAELDDGDAIIHRQAADGAWLPIPTYRPSGAWYVAAPLNADTAKRLVSLDIKTPQDRVEHYRLYWVPRSSTATAADTVKTAATPAKGYIDLGGA